MDAVVTLLLALAAAAPPAATNLLPGDTTFGLGPGPCTIRSAPGSGGARLEAGVLRLPAGLLAADLAEPLEDGASYTVAVEAWGRGALRLLVSDALGTVAAVDVPVPPERRTVWFSFTAREAPHAPGRAPGRVTIETIGAAEVWLDDPRLVAGAAPASVSPPELAVDCTVGDGAEVPVVWLEAAAPLRLAARGPASARARAEVRTPYGRVVAAIEGAVPGTPAEISLAELPVGLYEVVASIGDVERRRTVLVLHDAGAAAAAGPALSFEAIDRADEALRLGYRRVRLSATWAELAEDDGRLRPAALEEALAPAMGAGLEVTLTLRIMPAAAQPRRVRTDRKTSSHGFDRDVPMPDFARLEAFARELAAAVAGRGVTVELDDEPFRRWHAEDYSHYLSAFRGAVDDAAGAGIGFGGDPADVCAFLDEAARRGCLTQIAFLPVSLPGRLGEEPEQWLGGRLPTAADHLGTALLRRGWPAGVRWRAGLGGAAPDSRQYAARLLRAWYACLRAAPDELPTGWRGDLGPAVAAVAVWREQYGDARPQTRIPLGPDTEALVFERPDGRGVAAVWRTDDPREDPASARADGLRPVLRLGTLGGAGVAVRGLYGDSRPELYGGTSLGVPLDFEPVYLEARSAGVLERLLRAARLEGCAEVRLLPSLALVGGSPMLSAGVLNDGGAPVAGPVRLVADGATELPVSSLAYEAAPGQHAGSLVPFARFDPGTVGRVTLVAEAGHRLAMARRAFCSWWAETEGETRIDGREDDWPAEVPTYWLAGDQRLSPATPWLGPEDARLRWRGMHRERELCFVFDVDDDRLETAPRAAFDDADAVVVLLDLDPDPLDTAYDGDDYRVYLTPVYDGSIQGRVRIDRGPGDRPELLDRAGAEWRFRQTDSGYCFELRLSITSAGRDLLATWHSLGLDVRLHDDDGGDDRDLRLGAFGPAPLDRPGEWASVWLRGRRDPVGHLAYHPQPAPGPYWRADLQPLPGAGHLARVDDFVRGTSAVRCERRPPAETAVALLEVTPPAGRPPRLDLIIWARGSAEGRLIIGSRELTIESPEWRRYALAAPAGDRLTVSQLGEGWLEIAEIALEPPAVTPGDWLLAALP